MNYLLFKGCVLRLIFSRMKKKIGNPNTDYSKWNKSINLSKMLHVYFSVKETHII